MRKPDGSELFATPLGQPYEHVFAGESALSYGELMGEAARARCPISGPVCPSGWTNAKLAHQTRRATSPFLPVGLSMSRSVAALLLALTAFVAHAQEGPTDPGPPAAKEAPTEPALAGLEPWSHGSDWEWLRDAQPDTLLCPFRDRIDYEHGEIECGLIRVPVRRESWSVFCRPGICRC